MTVHPLEQATSTVHPAAYIPPRIPPVRHRKTWKRSRSKTSNVQRASAQPTSSLPHHILLQSVSYQGHTTLILPIPTRLPVSTVNDYSTEPYTYTPYIISISTVHLSLRLSLSRSRASASALAFTPSLKALALPIWTLPCSAFSPSPTFRSLKEGGLLICYRGRSAYISHPCKSRRRDTNYYYSCADHTHETDSWPPCDREMRMGGDRA